MPRVHLHLAHWPLPLQGDVADTTVAGFPFTIGRHPDCDWRLEEAEISRRHCVMTLHHGRVFVHDLDSTNGTYVNGREAVIPEELHDADELRLGGLIFSVRLDPEGAALPPRRAAVNPLQ
jgi:pSer/pThr/pTyr-binding forkhead associated (FHA) protein